MGVVYDAVDVKTGHPVALKLLARELSDDSDFIQRFLTEARAASRLNHPHIISVSAVGRAADKNAYYIAMEKLEGRSLDAYLAAGSFTYKQIIRIVAAVAGALEHAAERSIIHRDIKPQNVFLGSDGRVTLLDFGLAKCLDDGMRLTREGQTLGTPEYMSPEQAQSSSVDTRSDLYSLGVILYEMLAGAKPFEAPAVAGMVHLHHHATPRAISSTRPDVPADLEALVHRLLAKKPEDRLQSAGALLEALATLERGFGARGLLHKRPHGPPVPPKTPEELLDEVQRVEVESPPPTRRWIAIGAGLLGLAGLAAGLYIWL